MGETFSERFAVKLTRFRAGRPARKKREKQMRAATRRRAQIAARREERAHKAAEREETRYVLRMARRVLGYKTVKPTAAHLKALAEGRQRYFQGRAASKDE